MIVNKVLWGVSLGILICLIAQLIILANSSNIYYNVVYRWGRWMRLNDFFIVRICKYGAYLMILNSKVLVLFQFWLQKNGEFFISHLTQNGIFFNLNNQIFLPSTDVVYPPSRRYEVKIIGKKQILFQYVQATCGRHSPSKFTLL